MDTPVSAIWRHGRIEHVTSKDMVNALRAAVACVGEEKLGIKQEDIGTHSIRSDAAMAMFLGECPVYVIMMIGLHQEAGRTIQPQRFEVNASVRDAQACTRLRSHCLEVGPETEEPPGQRRDEEECWWRCVLPSPVAKLFSLQLIRIH